MSWKLAPALAAGLHVRRQAGRAGAGLDARVRRAGRGGRASRPACSTSSPASARTRARRWSRIPGVDKVAFTGVDGGRQAGDEGRGRAPRARVAGARRQVAAHRVRRRRSRGRGERRRRGDLRRDRADVHGRLAAVRRRTRSTTSSLERLAAAGARDPPRRSAGGGDRDGPGRLPRAPATWSRARSPRRRRGRPARHGGGGRARRCATGSSSSRRSSPTSTHEMDIAREEVFGPVLAVAAVRRRGGRRSRLRQRHAVRAGGRRVDARRPARAPRWRAASARRHGLDQRLPRRRPDGAVRRLQARRHGPRERPRRRSHEYTELKTVWIELTGATRDPFKLG